jgi:hypothetical protein
MDIIKELEALAYDLRGLKATLSENKRDADRGLKNDESFALEDQSKDFRLASLFSWLGDAYHDFDRRLDEVREIEDRLLDLIDKVEYDTIAQTARKDRSDG